MKNYKPSPLIAWIAVALFRGVFIIFVWIFGNFRWQYESFVNLLGQFYIWYSISFIGILIWFLRATIDAFCWAFILIWLYNILYKYLKK
jgi:hypothetical protein